MPQTMTQATAGSAIPWHDAAVLVWARPDTPPTDAPLDATIIQTPPHPNPVPFWRFSDAIEHATETIQNGRHAGKQPFIKVGAAIYSPTDIAALYQTIRAERP